MGADEHEHTAAPKVVAAQAGPQFGGFGAQVHHCLESNESGRRKAILSRAEALSLP